MSNARIEEQMDEMQNYYDVLGLELGASTEEIKQAYRDLVQVWHPDKFQSNPRLQNITQEKLKEINEAYTRLKDHAPSQIVNNESDAVVGQKPAGESVHEEQVHSSPQSNHVNPFFVETIKHKKIFWVLCSPFYFIIIALILKMLLPLSQNKNLILSGVLSAGVMAWGISRAISSGRRQNLRKNAASWNEIHKRIIESLLILASSGGINELEYSIILQVAKGYYDRVTDVFLKSVSNELGKNYKGNMLERYKENAKFLALALEHKEKLALLAVMELLIKADQNVSDEEKCLYMVFKETLKCKGTVDYILSIFGSCPVCKSRRTNFIDEEEVDRWRGTKNVTERLANGKDKTRQVQTTYVSIRRDYKCDECTHGWSNTVTREKT